MKKSHFRSNYDFSGRPTVVSPSSLYSPSPSAESLRYQQQQLLLPEQPTTSLTKDVQSLYQYQQQQQQQQQSEQFVLFREGYSYSRRRRNARHEGVAESFDSVHNPAAEDERKPPVGSQLLQQQHQQQQQQPRLVDFEELQYATEDHGGGAILRHQQPPSTSTRRGNDGPVLSGVEEARFENSSSRPPAIVAFRRPNFAGDSGVDQVPPQPAVVRSSAVVIDGGHHQHPQQSVIYESSSSRNDGGLNSHRQNQYHQQQQHSNNHQRHRQSNAVDSLAGSDYRSGIETGHIKHPSVPKAVTTVGVATKRKRDTGKDTTRYIEVCHEP
ncbi:putative uncharacterized protein DDB_G0271606 [Sabethes cyaneus]|uniref:putative uncharacterized protein DDB_G0271606 n=1 Tax=Sabethes cyaneus TaxID=53552 RepID=UPI00237E56D5|nr:putative uncharacterized protein DDB_G0271606 [Sabethes cyaneus]